MKKKHAFVAVVLSLLAMYFLTLALAPGAAASLGPAVVMGVVGAGGFSMGSNVADNWQRSKYYRSELDKKGVP
jgi:phosphate/sulfate permease